MKRQADPWAEPLPALDTFVGNYDAYLIDQFGVLLHGSGAYPQAPDTLRQLSDLGKRIILLSNSGKRAEPNIQRLLALGFDRSSFETVLSSGEVAYRYLSQRQATSRLQQQDAVPVAGSRVWVIAEHPQKHLQDLPLQLASKPQEADSLLIAGSDPRHASLECYRAALMSLAQRGAPCLCTNPDISRLSDSSGGLTFGPGAVARLYETLGGIVHWIGKPYPLMYQAACELLGDVDRCRVLCIGDSPAHDIAGGQAAGLCTALVTSGIHAHESLNALREHCRAVGVEPDHVIRTIAMTRC